MRRKKKDVEKRVKQRAMVGFFGLRKSRILGFTKIEIHTSDKLHCFFVKGQLFI